MSFNQLPLSDFNNGSINWFDDISSKPLSPIKPSNASISSRLSVQSIQKSPPAIQPPPPKKQRIPSSFLSSYKIHELMMESSSHNQNLSSDLIEALARWMVCIMVVQFDVEIGPDLKIIQPAIQFTEEDFQAICFSSLPERSSSKESKSQFHSFRFQSSTFPDTVLHGYALFSQQRSRSSSRGYIQESLVIVSRLDYPQLFNACLQLMADIVDHNREFNSSVEEENDMIYSQVRRKIHDRDGFIEDDDSSIRKRKLAHSTSVNSLLDEKLPIIHTAISNISQWPDPDPNSTLELGFLGTIINLSIPLYDSSPLLGTIDLDTKSANFHSHNVKGLSKHSVSTSDLTNFSCDPKLYTQHNAPVITATEPSANWDYLVNFVSDISDLYILYEYMLLAKPIVVYSSSPHLCSSFISLLVDLIRPIPYAGRIREYVTIHTCPSDMDSGIIGVTNPFLVKGIAKSDTLLFVLSPPENLSNSAKKALMSAPFQYYRTFHNGVGVLRRQSILRQSQSVNAMSTTPLSSMEKTDVAMNSPLAVTSPLGNRQSHANASWTSRLFSRYIPNFGFNNGKMHRRHIDKTGISMPITSTFAKLPTSFSAFGANITKTHKRNQSNSSEFETEQVNREEEARIKSLMRNARRGILKTRLLYPDPKFISSLTRLINQVRSAPNNNTGPEKSVDFAIRFHFATLTARFLGPLSCYLDPVEEEDNAEETTLSFAQDEFMRDLSSPTSSPKRRESLKMSRTNSTFRRRRSLGTPGLVAVTSNGGNQRNSWSSIEPAVSVTSNPTVSTSVVKPSGLLYPITSQDQFRTTTTAAMTGTTIATATTAIIVDNNATSARNSSANTVSLLRNLSRKSLVTGSTTSLPGAATAPATSTGLLMRASVDLDRGNSRSSMLSLSSLGLSFNGTGAGLSDGNGTMSEKAGFISNNSDSMNTDEEIFHYTSPPALPLQPPAPRRTSSRKFSGKHVNPLPPTTKPVNEEDEETETNGDDDITDNFEENDIAPAISLLPGLHESRVKRFQKQTADLHKQSIYKTFIGSDNFKEWLHMNNVNNNRKS